MAKMNSVILTGLLAAQFMILAGCAPQDYRLSTSCSPNDGGTVSPSGGMYREGNKLTLVASPAKNYKFDYWAGEVSGNTNPLTITINSNSTVVASFSKITYNLQTQINTLGSGNLDNPGGNYEANTTQTITANAVSGYRFDHWGGNASGFVNPVNVIMDADKTIVAYFSKVIAESPTPTSNQVKLNYSNRTYGFSLKFPQYWGDSEPNAMYAPPSYIVKFQAPDIEGCDIPITITIAAQELPPEAANQTLDVFMDKSEAVLQATANNYKRVSLTETTVSGLPARVLRWSMGDNSYLINDQAVFIYSGRVFIITYAALSKFHDDAFNGFELVTSTFQFK